MTVRPALAILRRRWCRELLETLQGGPDYFLSIQRRLSGIAHKVLTQQLNRPEFTGDSNL